ncbi:MAG: transglycosylase SLT domain-containing protein [Lachnospiraceae bacterium]|nr:transglycosylase SLT domain-containing protein [Lachnospiraceae bacterium]
METNTTHGRKIVREAFRKKQIKENTKAVLFILTVLLLGVVIGGAIVFCIKVKTEPIETPAEITPTVAPIETEADKNEYIMQHVNRFGSYDDRIFVNEISLDWSSGDLDFVPLDCELDEETQEFVFYLCEGYDIDWTLVMALMRHESEFTADVISRTNDFGLMQINVVNHEWLSDVLGITDFLDKEQNIRAGVFVLRKLFEKYTDTNMVLMAYNMGETGAGRLWKQGICSTNYVEKILKHQESYKKQLEERMVQTDEEMQTGNN